MKVFWSPGYTCSAHAFETTRKSKWIVESLERAPIAGVELVAPEPASVSALERIHDPAYVEAVRTGMPRAQAESQGFTWDPGLWDMVLASNGGAVAAALEAMETRGISGSLSSGLHHARYDHGAGFCTFNGLALAARAAIDRGAQSILVLDLDAHGGGGTHELTKDDERIWQVDGAVDSYDYYPSTSRQRQERVRDAEHYLPTVRRMLAAIERDAPRFDLCLYNAGMDPFGGCARGGLGGITRGMLRERERIVMEWCRERAIAMAFVLAGGYLGPELDAAGLVELHRMTLEAAAATSPGSPRASTRPGRSPA